MFEAKILTVQTPNVKTHHQCLYPPTHCKTTVSKIKIYNLKRVVLGVGLTVEMQEVNTSRTMATENAGITSILPICAVAGEGEADATLAAIKFGSE
jgi:hypothetical protein